MVLQGRDAIHVAFPTPNDLVGSAMSLIRLKDVYQLSMHDIVNARVPNLKGQYQFSGGLIDFSQI